MKQGKTLIGDSVCTPARTCLQTGLLAHNHKLMFNIEFFDRYCRDKSFGMYECITRITMVISHPAIKTAVLDEFVSLLDLAPTFME